MDVLRLTPSTVTALGGINPIAEKMGIVDRYPALKVSAVTTSVQSLCLKDATRC